MIVSFYAALLALMFIFLSVKTIKQRIKAQRALGDGGHHDLHRHVRAHGNFAEYTPFVLVLMLILEMENASSYLLHGLGIAFVLGRVLHAYSLTTAETYEGDAIVQGTLKFRQIGMFMTFGVLGVSALALLLKA
jgi:uncharacterized membrane protein YecN with MAPEG domain